MRRLLFSRDFFLFILLAVSLPYAKRSVLTTALESDGTRTRVVPACLFSPRCNRVLASYILMDEFHQMYTLKLKLEELQKEYIARERHFHPVTVEKTGPYGFLVRVLCKSEYLSLKLIPVIDALREMSLEFIEVSMVHEEDKVFGCFSLIKYCVEDLNGTHNAGQIKETVERSIARSMSG